MNTDIQVLFVSASAADELVLTTLLAHDESGGQVHLTAAKTAEGFFDAVYAERGYQVIVVDDRPSWSDWQTVVAACCKNQPAALLILLAGDEQLDREATAWDQSISAIYPRNSAGMITLARLVSRLAAQGRSFSLSRQEPQPEARDAGAGPVEEEREKLVYAVSHDLQDPLQLARRYAEILNEDYQGSLGESGSKVLGNLQFNLRRTQEMLDELLDYSRLQSAPLNRQPVDLNELLVEVTDLYKLTLEEVGGKIVRQHELPSLMVDRRQFQRLLQNLIGNAIKFRSERPLQITVRAQRVRNEWRIGIKDNGIGIADDDLRRIFGMFERAGAVEDYPGTGMGLAICKRIVQNHGGKIWVRSSLGSGSVFIFSVPQTEEPAEQLAG